MRLLSVIASLNPKTGGPAENVVILDRMFRRLGHQHTVVSLECGGEPWLDSLDFKPILMGPTWLGHFGYSAKLVRGLKSLKRDYDGVILHCLWQHVGVAARQAFGPDDPPVVVFPHGSLDPYFVNNFPLKGLKKRLYYRFIEAPLFRRAHAVLFTCDEERRLAAERFHPVVGNREVVRYGIDPPEFEESRYTGRFRRLEEELGESETLLFFGRIHPKKGIDLLLRAFAASTEAERKHTRILIAGPTEDALYEQQLRGLARTEGIEKQVSWLGPVYRDDKWFLLSLADAFVLPSHMENFGIAVVESLSRGTPVLVSDKVNIHGEITAAKAGLVMPDTLEGTAEMLRQWFVLPGEERRAMSANARKLVQDRYLAVYTAMDIMKIFGQGMTAEPMKDELTANVAGR